MKLWPSDNLASRSLPLNISKSGACWDRTIPNCSMALIAIQCAVESETPLFFCDSRTWSANGPPPGTTTIACSRLRLEIVCISAFRRSGCGARLPPTLMTTLKAHSSSWCLHRVPPSRLSQISSPHHLVYPSDKWF